MQHQEFEPPQQLQDVIKCFWYDTKDYGLYETSFEVVPDGYAEIIFYFGSLADVQNKSSLPSPFLMGLLNKPAVFYTKGQLQIIGVRCFPWTVFDLLKLPSGKESIHTFEHPVAALQSLLNELITKNKITEAMSAVQAFFLTMHAGNASDDTLSKAGSTIQKAKGMLPVSVVAAAAHTTQRTLERKFRKSSGHTVKDVSALMRFEQVRNHLWQHPDANLARLAAELGYTDQAHLTKEFKRYSSTTPAAFARKAKEGKPFTAIDFVAFVQG